MTKTSMDVTQHKQTNVLLFAGDGPEYPPED